MAIKNFTDKEAAKLFDGQFSRKLPRHIQRRGMRRLAQLNGAAELQDLKLPPSNRLEQLQGDRKGQFSIRINQQYRLCFIWKSGNAHDVEIVDYHKAGRN
jgi:proteic killer suppression protein